MAKIIPPLSEFLKNPNLNENILDAYYCLEPTLYSIKEKENLNAENFINTAQKSLLFQPFSVYIFGAYLMSSEMTDINYLRKECLDREFTLLMKKYATGFHFGYYNFERDVLETMSNIFGKDINRLQVIYDHISLGYPDMFDNSTSYIPLMNDPASQMPSSSNFSKAYNVGVKRGNFYRAWYLILKNHKVFEEFFILQMTSENKPPKQSFTTKEENIKDWILPDYIDLFFEIEKELFDRGYIDNSYKWQMGENKGKVKLIDFLCVIIEYKYFKQRVNGKNKEDYQKRHFISERYGFEKTGLSESAKKYIPTLKLALGSFSWINPPEETPFR